MRIKKLKQMMSTTKMWEEQLCTLTHTTEERMTTSSGLRTSLTGSSSSTQPNKALPVPMRRTLMVVGRSKRGPLSRRLVMVRLPNYSRIKNLLIVLVT